MSRCLTQRDDGGGGVYMTALLPKYRTVAALAPSQGSMRQTPPVRVEMEWDTSGVRAHRPRCQHPVLYGQEQSVQRVPKIDTGPVGGSPIRPRHLKVTIRTWCDESPPLTDGSNYMRLGPHMALDRLRMVYRAIRRTSTLEVLDESSVKEGIIREREDAPALKTTNRWQPLKGHHHS